MFYFFLESAEVEVVLGEPVVQKGYCVETGYPDEGHSLGSEFEMKGLVAPDDGKQASNGGIFRE